MVIHSDYVYTFLRRQVYINPTERIDLRCFTFLSKEIAIEPSSHQSRSKLSKFKRFSSGSDASQREGGNGEVMHLILLSDLNRDETFVFKTESQWEQTRWIYSFERALEYRCNLISTLLPPPILKYVVSLYFLSFERLRLATLSRHFQHLFSA